MSNARSGKPDLQSRNAAKTGMFAANVKDGSRARVVCEPECTMGFFDQWIWTGQRPPAG